jgi:hypothetical protein
MATTRNRIIYQSQALFIAPSSTGFHIQTGNNALGTVPATDPASRDDTYNLNWTGVPARKSQSAVAGDCKNRSLIEPMERIQSANLIGKTLTNLAN